MALSAVEVGPSVAPESAGVDGVAARFTGAPDVASESAGVDGVAVGSTGAPDGLAVELPAIVGVGDDEGAGGAARGAESAIVGCRSVGRYLRAELRPPSASCPGRKTSRRYSACSSALYKTGPNQRCMRSENARAASRRRRRPRHCGNRNE